MRSPGTVPPRFDKVTDVRAQRTRGPKFQGQLVIVLSLLCALALGACNSDKPEQQGPRATESAAGQGAEHRSGDTVHIREARRKIERTLTSLAVEIAEPSRQQLRSALESAGLPGERIEISITRTPTGLRVEAVETAVRVDQQCVVAQLRDGSVTATVLPVLATGYCFVGDQR